MSHHALGRTPNSAANFFVTMPSPQYETAVLDMGRLVFAYQWSRADFGVPALNRNSYNKDVRSAAWLATRCDALLNKRHA